MNKNRIIAVLILLGNTLSLSWYVPDAINVNFIFLAEIIMVTGAVMLIGSSGK